MIYNQTSICCLVLLAVCLLSSETAAQKVTRFVELEVAQSRVTDLTSQHQWMEMLSDVGATRVRSIAVQSFPRPSISESKSANVTTIRIKGHIQRNRLHLPGGSFAITNKAGIQALIKRLKDDGAEVGMAEKKAFGLTAPQLVAVHEDLADQVSISTKGQHVGASVLKMITDIKTPVVLSAEARKALTSTDKIAEELRGVSVGTAVAAAIRPLGLVMSPHRSQGNPVEIRILDTRDAKENWPVGWPAEGLPAKVAPKLFTRTDIEIKGFALKSVLNSIENRLKMPFLYDHNTLARKGIDPSEVKVTFTRKQVGYMTALRKMLAQSKPKMYCELRVDENAKPFLWITAGR